MPSAPFEAVTPSLWHANANSSLLHSVQGNAIQGQRLHFTVTSGGREITTRALSIRRSKLEQDSLKRNWFQEKKLSSGRAWEILRSRKGSPKHDSSGSLLTNFSPTFTKTHMPFPHRAPGSSSRVFSTPSTRSRIHRLSTKSLREPWARLPLPKSQVFFGCFVNCPTSMPFCSTPSRNPSPRTRPPSMRSLPRSLDAPPTPTLTASACT